MQKYSIKEETLRDIAGAIRNKCQIENKLTPVDFTTALVEYNSNLEEYINYDSDTIDGLLRKLPPYVAPSSTNGTYMFYNCTGLEEVPSKEFMQGLTNTSYMFRNCLSLKTFPEYDTGGATTNASYMFYGSGLESFSPSSFFDLVTNASYMFYGCKNLKTVGSLNSLTALTNASYMFYGCQNLKTMPDICTDNITSAEYCFSNTGIENIEEINFPKATSASYLITGCKSLKKIKKVNLPTLTSANYLLCGSQCEEIDELRIDSATSATYMVFGEKTKKVGSVYAPLVTKFYSSSTGHWFGYTSNDICIEEIDSVTCGDNPNLDYIFNKCKKLKKVPQFVFNGSATGIGQAFRECKLIEEIPYFSTSNAQSLAYTFYECNNLKRIPNNLDLSNVANIEYAFYNCYKLEDLGGLEFGTISSSISNSFYNARSLKRHPKMDCSKITSVRWMFQSCKSLEEIKSLHFDSATTIESVFGNLFSVERLTDVSFEKITEPSTKIFPTSNSGYTYHNNLRDIDGFSLPAMTTASGLFSATPLLTNIRKFSAPNNTNASSLFSGKTRLERLIECDFGEKLTNVASMFYNCKSLKKAPLLYTNNITSMSSMFYGCSSLEEVSFYGGCDNLTTVTNMFANASETGVFKYDARYNYGAVIAQLPAGWTTEPLIIPQECTGLEIECDDVIGRATSALIKFKATVKGLNTQTGEIVEGVEITGDWWSDKFEENYSETDSVVREIKFDYMGIEATTTVTQLPRKGAYCVVMPNTLWEKDVNVGNPDPEEYDGPYINYSTAGASNLILEIQGYDHFKLHFRCSGGNSYAYTRVSDEFGEIMNSKDWNYPVTNSNIYDYCDANLYHLNGKKTTITISVYRSSYTNIDASILIPINQ